MLKFAPDMIIWSADVSKVAIKKVIEARALPEGTVIKLDRLFFENHSKYLIRFCQENGYPVFCDAKIIEVPSKCLAIADTYLTYRPFMLNIMAGACSTGQVAVADVEQADALKRFADACLKAGTRSCAVTVLTSKTDELTLREFSMNATAQVVNYVDLAWRAGMTDIVCSPAEAATIRECGYQICLNTPGVRPAGDAKNDQQRVTTPGQAIKNGANRVIIGRPMTAGDGDAVERVARNYERIRNEILSAIAEINAADAEADITAGVEADTMAENAAGAAGTDTMASAEVAPENLAWALP